MPKFKIVNPCNDADWNKRIATFPDATIFHTREWASILQKSYNYTPEYIVSTGGSDYNTILPFFSVKSFLTGKRGVGLPFTDFCNVLAREKDTFAELIPFLKENGKEKNWNAFELRGVSLTNDEITPSQQYLSHNLSLHTDEKDIYQNFRSSTKRNIKKAQKENVAIRFDDSLSGLKKFYELNCLTRKKHGLPPQPFTFFKNFYSEIIDKKKGYLILASYDTKDIAGAIFMHHGKKVIYKYGASDTAYQNVRANNLIFWEAIKYYRNNGFDDFNFGKTLPFADGLRQFKNGWGAQEYLVNYYKYSFKSNTFITETPSEQGKYNTIFRALPVPALKLAGNLLYRHVG